MKILFMSNYSGLYGANRSMLTIVEYFKNKGHDVFLILPEHGEIENELKERAINYNVISCFTQLYYYKLQLKYLALPFLVLFSFFQLPKIKKQVRDFKPDLIYSNTSAENLGIKVAKSLGIKHISHIREFMDWDHGAKFIFGNKKKQMFINQSDGIIYVSKAVANHVNDGIPLQSWQQVIYNGVETKGYFYSDKLLTESVNLGIVGILDSEKGQDVAIKMMPAIIKCYPQCKLHIWGDKDGHYKKKLYHIVDKMNLSDHVIFHGFEKNPNVIYKDMDVLMMCSRCEGFGRVTIEAMQRGIPVMGFNKGGTAELIKNGKNGFLFSSQKECVLGLRTLLASEIEFNKFRKFAYEYASTNFSIDLYCSQVESFVKAIIDLKYEN